ncbi:hypothetical protein [Mucisphaera calidilacus]|uniref:DUF2029 domain-containing protein n=1 Tax=Mucisphaera calidilacus TaxID=2527982 RepID=A0A518BUP3_9BACT|nr:hypothetical protein [Mucisphaera calidilacus]QDU70671.1 hypothetical protein Pan265_05010 [Mucisphaera calidilacus]
MREGMPLSLPVWASAKGVVLAVLCLVMMSLTWVDVVDARLGSLGWLWAGALAGWCCLSWLGWRLGRCDGKAEGFGRAAVVVVLVGLVARVVVSLGTTPVLSDDIWRYIHDGSVLASGANPYAVAPAELGEGERLLPGVVERVNNPGLVTIYLPTSQWVFAGVSRLYEGLPAGWRAWDGLRDHTFRVVFGLADVGVVVALVLLLGAMGRSAWWAALYAWHPLVLAEVSGSGHQDSLGVLGLVVAVWCWVRLLRGGSGVSAAAMGIALAASVLVKPMGLLLVPAMVVSLWGRRGWLGVSVLSGVVTGLAVGLPFVAMDGGVGRLLETGERFVEAWAFNGSAHALLVWALGEKGWADVAAGVLLAGVSLGVAWRGLKPACATGWVLLAALLLSSTAHPWYALWMLPFVVAGGNRVGWLLSLMVLLAYVAHLDGGYELAWWVVWAEYVPVYALLLWVLCRWSAGGADDEAGLGAD